VRRSLTQGMAVGASSARHRHSLVACPHPTIANQAIPAVSIKVSFCGKDRVKLAAFMESDPASSWGWPERASRLVVMDFCRVQKNKGDGSTDRPKFRRSLRTESPPGMPAIFRPVDMEHLLARLKCRSW